MANYHLSLNNDKYQIFIDNSSQENTLSNNEQNQCQNKMKVRKKQFL